MTRLLALYGVGLVFASVLVAQLGVPIPALPVMIAAGALGADGGVSAIASFALAVTATVIADSIWYVAGRMYGDRVLKLLGRVPHFWRFGFQQVNARLDRWGPLALALAKFIPGFSTIAPALAGSGGIPYFRFLVFDALGAVCWAGTMIAIGVLLGAEWNSYDHLSSGTATSILQERRPAPERRPALPCEGRGAVPEALPF